jgi:hypothetical protein
MPRLNNRFKHMAFFLYGKNPRNGRLEGPLGTGVFLGLEGRGTWYLSHFYAVTCYHVAVKSGASILCVNTKTGSKRFIDFEPHEWQFVPNGPDLCAVDITERMTDEDEWSVLPPSLVIDEDFIAHEQVEIGEDGFMLGLFADHAGKKQNLVAARFGNLSLLAHKDEPIEQPNGYKGACHIFDMRSRPGFSGSPVFIYRTPAGDLRDHADRGRWKRTMRRSRPSYEVMGGGDDIIRDRDRLKIPSSMAVVVPAREIANLLNLPVFQTQRDERNSRMEKERDKRNIPEPESAADKSDLGDEENPNHLEDFKRLVDVASRKKPNR